MRHVIPIKRFLYVAAFGLATVAAASVVRAIPAMVPSQVTGVAAFHRQGQTFITWREIGPTVGEQVSIAEHRALRQRLVDEAKIRYRIYRSQKPIDRLADATLVGEATPLSAWNGQYFGVYPDANRPVPRYVIQDDAAPIAPGMGLFVYNPPSEGTASYVVTTMQNGVENTAVGPGNTIQVALESPGSGVPVLQRVQKNAVFQYVERATLRFYVRWETGANSSVPGQPFDYLVAIPPGMKEPAPVGLHLHGWGGSLTDGYGWWYNAEKGAVLLSSNQVPYDWWTGYHEGIGRQRLTTAEQWRAGVVRPYTINRMLSFVDWLGTTMKIDRARTFVAGNSMGGSGALMMAIRYPDRLAWAISWVGIHVPHLSPQFSSSYQDVWGRPEWGVRFEDGTPVWDYFNDVWYLRQHPDRDVGLLVLSNGRNDGAIGWRQAVEFVRALQEARQPHVFWWGQGGHGQRAYMPARGGERVMPLDLTTNQSLPAFSHCSLDDDVGDGSSESGAPEGQINADVSWKPDSVVDEPERWSVTIEVLDGAPKSEGIVDVTARRLQRLKLQPGDRMEWTNTSRGRIVQRGEAVIDKWGLLTLRQVQVSRAGNRVLAVKAPPRLGDVPVSQRPQLSSR